MKKKSLTAGKTKGFVIAKTNTKDEVLSESESLSKIRKACENCTDDSACCAIVGLKKAGWEITISDGVNHEGRKGLVINMVEPIR